MLGERVSVRAPGFLTGRRRGSSRTFAGFEKEGDAAPSLVLNASDCCAECRAVGVIRDVFFVSESGLLSIFGLAVLSYNCFGMFDCGYVF